MTKKGIIAISPLILFLVFYVAAALFAGDFSKVPITVIFLFSSVYAVAITKGLSVPDRGRIFGRGAGATKVMFMVLIFLTAGAFSSCAEAMGCISSTVNIILSVLPARYIYVSIFLAGCLISMATGSGIGSIVALGPIAVGVGEAIGGNLPLLCAIVVCGAMFGDNLSFISDTTVIATSTQGCELKDKFKVNLWIAVPASILVILLYIYLGRYIPEIQMEGTGQFIKLLPYIAVITLSIIGIDVLVVLLSGTALCGVMGIAMHSFDFFGWMSAIDKGLMSMSSIVIIVIFASGLMALISYNGGIDFIVSLCTRFVKSRRSAEFCIAALSGLMCLCTSNNTIAIISISSIVKEISIKYGVDPRKAASLMDSSSCIVLELIPYSAHLLAAGALASISAVTMIPYMFYPPALLFFMILSIVFNIPNLKKGVKA